MKDRTIQISPTQYKNIIKLKREQGRTIKGQLEYILSFYFKHKKPNKQEAL